MIYLYNSKSFNPYYNLAIEDYFVEYANRMGNCFILYFWQNENTVVIGRNQDAFCECNLDNLIKNNCFLARRKTGGGAVFHDKNNLNFSFIVPKYAYDKKASMEIIKDALNFLGFSAEISGRNDVLVEKCKCSGSAYLMRNNVILHHGTILLDTNTELMVKLLNVKSEKLKSKGVTSVKNRVVNLKSINKTLDIEKVKNAIKLYFEQTYKAKCENFKPNIEKIKAIELFYADELWIYGDKKFANIKCYDKKFDWGMCEIKIIKSDNKSFIKIYSDALNYEGVEKAEKLLNKYSDMKSLQSKNKIIVEIFEFYNEILALQ